jgi:hypothetical protein
VEMQIRACVLMLALLMGAQSAALAAPALNGAQLRPYTNLWKLTIRLKGGRVVNVGTWSDQISRTKVGSAPALERIQISRLRKRGDTQTFINVFDPVTMRPYSSVLSSSAGDITMRRFNGRTVRIIDAGGPNRGVPVTTTQTVKENAYDFDGGMYGLLFLGMRLAPNRGGILTTFGVNDATIEHIAYHVVGKQRVEARPGAFVQAWVVDAHYLDAHRPEADAQMRFWLSTAPPYIIKLIYDLPKEGQTWYYTMI